MAVAGDKAEKQLREITECSICRNTFTDPRILPCTHTFCLECLKSTGEVEQKKPGDTMSCPFCQKDFIIPPEGAIGLQKNFFMENIMDLKTTLQNTLPSLKIGIETKEEVKQMSHVKFCNQHNQKPLDYYCAECKTVVCVSCFVESHKMHDCWDVATVDESVRQTIRSVAGKTSCYADEMLSLRVNSEMIKKNFLENIERVEMTIIKRNQDLKDVIDNQTHSLLDELTAIKSINLKEMEIKFEDINRCRTMLRNLESYCTELVLKGSAIDICSSVDQLTARVHELELDRKAFIGRPNIAVELSFHASLGDVLQIENGNFLGKIEVQTDEDKMDYRNGIEMNKKLIVQCLDTDFGLLDELLANQSLTKPEVATVKAVSDTFGRSDKLLEHVAAKEIFEKFLNALKVTKQTHLANFILNNGSKI